MTNYNNFHAFTRSLTPLLVNGLWYLLSWPESFAFRLARHNVAGAQQKLLLKLLRRNAGTEFGRRYGFGAIRSVAEYQARVPLSSYDDYQEAIARIGAGQQMVLTREPVLLLEPTSGSTTATKHIPYTAALKAEFQRAIAPWVVNLFGHEPTLMGGQAYWSVTPVTRRNSYTPAGIPIGFEEDSEYFGGWQRHLIRSVLAVPPLVRLIDEMEAFRYVSLLFLLRSRSLTLISIWNPTFLTLLVKPLSDWWPRLARDIAAGTLSPPTPLAPDLQKQLNTLNQPDGRRAAEIQSAFHSGNNPGSIHARLWPRLRLISCWADAQAAPFVPKLNRLFPQARVQGKGLLATEGFVSFPLESQPAGAALAVRSHFFEFLPVDRGPDQRANSSTPRLAHELESGENYAAVISTGGGLYRYRLHDLVQVVGYWGSCPLLKFVGKESYISDWFGEKLNELHVRLALDEVFGRHSLQPAFAMVACDERAGQYAYTLFIESREALDEELILIGQELEAKFQTNYHYRYCRNLGQLDSLRVFRVEDDALETYLSTCQSHGQRAGDIKPVTLHRLGGWSRAFRGYTVTS